MMLSNQSKVNQEERSAWDNEVIARNAVGEALTRCGQTISVLRDTSLSPLTDGGAEAIENTKYVRSNN